jgi:aryl carrier-like protein
LYGLSAHDLSAQLISERCGVALDAASLMRALSAAPAAADWSRDVTHAALASLISLAGSSPTDELRDLGLDSVRGMELIENLHRLGVLVESVSVMECQRLEQLYEVVRGAPRQVVLPRAERS